MDTLITSIPLNVWLYGGGGVITILFVFNIINQPDKRKETLIILSLIYFTFGFIAFSVAYPQYVPKIIFGSVIFIMVFILPIVRIIYLHKKNGKSRLKF